jgi:hypothetical protein
MTLAWGQSFITLWVGPEYFAGPIPTLLVTVMVAQLTLIRNDANLINLTLDLPTKVIVGILSVALSLGIAAVLISVYRLGITGLCLGFIAGRSILSIVYPWSLGRFLGVAFHTQLQNAIRPTVVTALLFWLLLRIRSFLVVDSWPELIFFGSVTLVVVSFAAFFAGLSREQRKHIWARGQMAIG